MLYAYLLFDKMNRPCKYHFTCAFLMMVLFGCGETEIDPQAVELYRQGNLLYEQSQFAEASRTYERIIQKGIQNGYVYYNLGNAYFRQQKVGQAILAYERANRLIPRDDDVKTNLAVANLKTIDQITIEMPWFGRRMVDAITVNECTVLTSVLGGLTLFIFLAFLLARAPTTRRVLVRVGTIFCIVFILSGGLTGFKIYTTLTHQDAIILNITAVIRSSPDETAAPLFSLHDGTKVQIIEIRGAWMRIQLTDGKNGWLQHEQLEVI